MLLIYTFIYKKQEAFTKKNLMGNTIFNFEYFPPCSSHLFITSYFQLR